jgi:hypothetical protein
MKYVKLFEDFKKNNQEGSLITKEDIISCIKSGGILYATIIKKFVGNDPKKALKPVSIDDDGEVTIEYDGKEYEVSLRNIESIEY